MLLGLGKSFSTARHPREKLQGLSYVVLVVVKLAQSSIVVCGAFSTRFLDTEKNGERDVKLAGLNWPLVR